MKALSLATLGLHCASKAVAVATLGVICPLVIDAQISNPGFGYDLKPKQDHFHLKPTKKETALYKTLYQEDEEVIALVVSMVNAGILK